MPSSLNSNHIAAIKGLHLVYEIDHYRNQSVKDLFIGMLGSPLKTLKARQKYYHVLENIEFDVFDGDRIGLIGVNGAGKTSLCRCIAGMITPDKGSVHINGKIRAIFDTGIGVVPELTGRENAEVITSLLYPDVSLEDRKSIIEDSLSFSELGEFLDVPYLKYSKGMQTRLSLSLVSARSCDLLILDEVYDGADIFFQEKVSKRVLKMIKESGAVIFVSHSIDQIEAACNRLILLDKSRIIYDGSVENGISLYKQLLQHT